MAAWGVVLHVMVPTQFQRRPLSYTRDDHSWEETDAQLVKQGEFHTELAAHGRNAVRHTMTQTLRYYVLANTCVT